MVATFLWSKIWGKFLGCITGKDAQSGTILPVSIIITGTQTILSNLAVFPWQGENYAKVWQFWQAIYLLVVQLHSHSAILSNSISNSYDCFWLIQHNVAKADFELLSLIIVNAIGTKESFYLLPLAIFP